MAAIKFDTTGDNRNVLESFKGVQNGVRQMQSVVEKSGQSIDTMFDRIKNSFLGGVKDMAKGLIGLKALMESGTFIKSLYDDMGKFTVAMKEVSTLSEDVTNDLDGYKNKVVDICKQIAIAPEEAAKALYQIESAGHHGADGLNVLEQAAKGAIGGVTETEVAADAITTILNSYKMEAKEAAHINDLLFTTVRLGKTTYGELGRVIAQVTPVASAYGVAIEDVLAAVASLTKSGTKTSIAVRQVRDAITATTASLGDGTFQTRTFLEAMDEVAEKTKGSESALKSDLSKLSAMNAVLALTGKNAAAAKQDFMDMLNSEGAATAAYEKMADTAGNASIKLRNNFFAYFMPIGDEIRSMSKSIAESMNEAFDDGSMQTALGTLEAFIASYALYRGLVATTNVGQALISASEVSATNAAYDAEIAQLNAIIPLKEAEAKTDIEIAVAEGRLAPEKANLILALREEAKAHLEALQAEAAKANLDMQTAVAEQIRADVALEAAQAEVAAAELKYNEALRYGSAIAIENAELELNVALSNQSAAASTLEAARKTVATATTKAATTAKAADAAATMIDASAQKADAVSTGILAGAKLQLKKAIDLVNASFLASPLFWMAATVIGVSYAVYKLCTAESETEAATRKANEALKEQNDLNEERKQNVQNLLRTIQDKNQTELAQLAAYNELKTIMPDITDKYSLQALAAMDAADSQKELNGELEKQQYDEAKKKAEQYRKEVEKLKKEIGDGTPSLTAMYQSQYSGRNSQVTAKRQLPQAEANLKIWEDQVRKYEELQAELADNAKPIELRIQEAKENVEVKQEIFDFYKNAKDLAEHWQEANEQIDYTTGTTRLEAFIAQAETELEDLRQQQQNNPQDWKIRLLEEEKTKILNGLIDMKNRAEKGGFNQMDFFLNAQFNFDYAALQAQLQKALARLNGLTANTIEGGALTLQEEYDAAKTRYDAAMKKLAEIDANRSKYTKEQRIAAESELKTAKEGFAAVGGDPEGKTAKNKANEAKRLANERAQRLKAEQRYNDMLKKQRVERERTAKDLELSTTQAQIDAMEEGSRKTIAQINLDFEKQKVEIERGYEDLKQSKIDKARQLWEANPANKGKLFDESTVNTDYTEEERKNYMAQLDANAANYRRSMEEVAAAEMQNLYDYLKEYGTIEQQRYAITKEYDAKIAKENSETRKKILEEEKKSALSQVTAQSLAMNIDWNQTFSGLGNVLEGLAKETLANVREYMKTDEYKGLGAADKQAYQDLVSQLVDAGGVDASSPFKTKTWDDIAKLAEEYKARVQDFLNAQKTHKEAVDRLVEAENELKNATTPTAQAMAQMKVNMAQEWVNETGQTVNQTEQKKDEANEKLHTSTESAAKGLDNFSTTLNQLTSGTLSGFATGVYNLVNQISGSGKKAAASLGEIGGKAGGLIGAILQIIDALGEDPAKFIEDLLDKVARVVEAILRDLPEIIANVVKGVVNIVGGVFSGIGQLFGADLSGIFGGSTHNFDEATKKWGWLLDTWKENLEYEKELMKDAYGDKVTDIQNKTTEQLRQTQQAASQLYRAWASDGGGWFSHSNGYKDNRGANWSYLWQYDPELAKKMGAEQKYLFGNKNMPYISNGSVSNLFNLSADELEKLKYGNRQFWESLSEEARKYLDTIIDAEKEIKQLEQEAREQLTSTSFDSLSSDFQNQLTNMDSEAEDFADNFEKYMKNAVISSLMISKYKPLLEAWYKNFANAMESDSQLTAQEQEALKKEYDNIVNAALAERDSLKEMLDWSGGEEYTQEASSKGFQAMSQDTGEELNGRFTALQIAGETISSQIIVAVATLNGISSFSQSSNSAILEIRNMMIMTNSYLEDMVKYAKLLYTEFGTKLDSIVSNTENL